MEIYTPMELEIKQARKIALEHQLYRQHRLSGKDGLRSLITQLGYVQIDTISVVERAHHHTIWSRMNAYNKLHLDELLTDDRAIFEYWGHALSYLPIEDYRYSLPRMQRFPDAKSWEKQFWDKYQGLMADVLQRIKQEGPLSSTDFSDDRAQKPATGWGSEKPAKLALDLLFWKGELMISGRKGFKRVYDLRERVLPESIDVSMPSPKELYSHYVLRSLAAMGIGSFADIQAHFMVSDRKLLQETLDNLIEDKHVQPVSINGIADMHYILPQALDSLQNAETTPKQLYLLSPFDNSVILRPRLKRLFDFDYTLECYVTPAKRKYGYWCLPVLYGEQFIGRIDCKANRKTKQMEVVNLFWEPDYKTGAKLKQDFQQTFDRFAAFCGCKPVDVF